MAGYVGVVLVTRRSQVLLRSQSSFSAPTRFTTGWQRKQERAPRRGCYPHQFDHTALSKPITNESKWLGWRDNAANSCRVWSKTVLGPIWNHGAQPEAGAYQLDHTTLSKPTTNKSTWIGFRDTATTCCVTWSKTVSGWI